MVNNLINISTYSFQGWTKIPTKISTYHINKQQKSLLPFANPYISLCKVCLNKMRVLWSTSMGFQKAEPLPITFVSAYFDLPFVNLKVWYDASLQGFHVVAFQGFH
ncbi:hypothetical protein HN51_039171, partial [Arachis hypogaea]